MAASVQIPTCSWNPNDRTLSWETVRFETAEKIESILGKCGLAFEFRPTEKACINATVVVQLKANQSMPETVMKVRKIAEDELRLVNGRFSDYEGGSEEDGRQIAFLQSLLKSLPEMAFRIEECSEGWTAHFDSLTPDQLDMLGPILERTEHKVVRTDGKGPSISWDTRKFEVILSGNNLGALHQRVNEVMKAVSQALSAVKSTETYSHTGRDLQDQESYDRRLEEAGRREVFFNRFLTHVNDALNKINEGLREKASSEENKEV